MEVLDFLDLAVHEGKAVAKAVEAYIEANKEMLSSLDVVVRISICKTAKGKRTTRDERYMQLQQLMDTNPTLPKVCKEGEYKFDFENLTFKRGKAELHFSAGEIVMLYQKLVRKQAAPTNWSAFLSNMRRRHGADFLEGIV
jgi:hypothetical protein